MNFPAHFGNDWQQLPYTLGQKKLFQLQRGSSEMHRPHLPWELCLWCSISLLWTCWAKHTEG